MSGRLDDIDRGLLDALQEDCKASLAELGLRVGISAPSVHERVRKLEHAGVIKGYRAIVDGRAVGLDITAFIGVAINYPKNIQNFERVVQGLVGVLECHHVTGQHTLLIKVRAANTASLEQLLSRIREIDGVDRTETMVVLSTHVEATKLHLDPGRVEAMPKRARRGLREVKQG